MPESKESEKISLCWLQIKFPSQWEKRLIKSPLLMTKMRFHFQKQINVKQQITLSNILQLV
ncbi:hypothetical protein NEIMUCOT_03829 [Neisseria mucosa ATCC 25996]|uniref:Uncharacterized protein n=1 Tax=Neisseria mucosa (strain ATCC 25996 / DSM 4631 / NCTC 10774 / M26) TaxID=546266 RepID=D2ZT93_NEIM2|nr:hypothetical protein NEIMUCOT_03829 [Neisseria mucosa ATCC 25996]